MFRLLGRAFRDFRATYPKLLLFEYLYMLATSVIVVPVITFMFNRILTVVGSGSLLNGDVYRLGLSYNGVLGLALIGLVASLAVLIELIVLIILVQQHYFGKNIAISDAVKTTIRQAPRLLGFGIFQLLFLLLILIPFIDSPLSASFYALFNVPVFLNREVLDASFTMTFVYALLIVVALYALLRWIFALHFIVLEGKTTTQAIRSSQALTRGRRPQLFLSLFLFNATVFAAGSSAISSLSYLPSWLDINVLTIFSRHYSLTLSTILTYMFALLLLPVNIILLTRLFYNFNRSLGVKPQDRLTIYRSRLGRLEGRIGRYVKGIQRRRLLMGSMAVVYMSLSIFIGLRATGGLVYAKWSVTIAAHRGDAAGGPENSLPSILSAIDKDMTAVELDVQLTKDGVAVLFHDGNLLRMTGKNARIADLTYAQLGGLDIGEDENGETVRIPTLGEVLSEAQGRIKLIVDLKPYGNGDALAEEVVRLIRDTGMEKDVYVQSFDGNALRHIRALDPDIKIGQILYFALGNLSALDVDFYTIEQIMLTKQLVKQAHAGGREVWVWTVNDRRDLKEVLKFQVDGIITDNPTMAQSMVEVDL
ncbi:glycerophosphodiester phosphodiesterase [Cohnella rhizosphaerae]|uniref:Glycerophosphodiester phosphodiesterase n=1 Tax=Cohnella rhizosphaerae TaxID=1457232 RepID=A0A9X4QRL0_9BACL|nr:glycerophosphodiester phosphodiesterase [Cohnella rhizosphaerae]MDG0809156.1 glycerophosphodiester phosphodiesterase [Cohnella rhizosphaerae]